ncbi:MAG: 4Fe-4S dicluster domain-containing protein [Lachnospirales bacterium]
MKKFDTKVQYLKYKVLRETARLEVEGQLLDKILDIPSIIIPGDEATIRCCVYKERAIVSERIKIAMGGDKTNPNVVEVIGMACDKCPMGGYEVTGACRGCLANRCEDVCMKGAISFDENRAAHIDKSKCVECGLCTKVCPFSAIINHKRPCESACKINAISMTEDYVARIDSDKCISCGACVYQCPWGAIMDKSFILNAIDIVAKSEKNTKYNTYAVVAPAIATQFSFATLGQVVSGIKALGFHKVVEAALGADIVAFDESKELVEKGFLTSSCCPAFVDYTEKFFPDLTEFVSHNPSPMAAIAKHIKTNDPTAKVVFIGPCTAKKMEFQKPEVRPFVDCVITFEELQALFDSRDIEITELEEDSLNDASYYGRIFARSGGLSDAVAQGVKEHGSDFELKALPCDGIEACKVALLKKSKNVLPENFIEGMACVDGCIGGAGCLTRGPRNKKQVDNYGKDAVGKTISSVVNSLE